MSRVARWLALGLFAIIVGAAARQFPRPTRLGAGVVPAIPDHLDVAFVLPWVGTILARSMGILSFACWTARRGFGGGIAAPSEPEPHSARPPPAVKERWLRDWLRTLTWTAILGVVAGTLVISGFLILGVELLGPRDIVPSGSDVARQLTRLLDTVGSFGYWAMLAAIVVALGGSVIANQDGWGRSFADITLLLGRKGDEPQGDEDAWRQAPRALRRLSRLGGSPRYRRSIKNVYVIAGAQSSGQHDHIHCEPQQHTGDRPPEPPLGR